MKKLILFAILFSLTGHNALAQGREVRVGSIPGYVTLKCDFHMHTVFSDGEVWPTVRIDEAEKEGLDVIAITDHIEYQPHKEYSGTDLNAAWKIASEEARKKNILLIHGAEITRKMPPGHFNALFIDDASTLTDKDFMTVIKEAIGQGAFIEWNHPGWKAQRPRGDVYIDSIHKVLLKNGWLHGIEIANDIESYQGVLPVCLENHLAVMANSDIHGPFAPDYYPGSARHRPVTLVFSKGRSEKELKEALFAGRTLAWFGDSLAGNRIYAEPFVKSCLEVGKVYYQTEKYTYREIINHSDVPFEVTLKSDPEKAEIMKLSIPANSNIKLRLKASPGDRLVYVVNNVSVSDKLPLEFTFEL